MELSWEEIVIDKRAVLADADDLLEAWLWLAPKDAEPMLPTAWAICSCVSPTAA